MADDVDDLLRRAMATLERETPAGYFDELPQRTLARLDADRAVDDPGDELARARARTERSPSTVAQPGAAPPDSSSQRAIGGAPGARPPGRRWRVAFALAGTGLAAAVVVLLFSVTRHRASEPDLGVTAPRMATAGTMAPQSAQGAAEVTRPAATLQAAPGRSGDLGVAAAELAFEDFYAGMRAVVAQARQCLPPGPRGSATLEVTVLSSGEVAEVKAAPPYAGTAAEACVARAVKSHTFPSWSGAPQTYRYRLPTAARVGGGVESGGPRIMK